MSVNAVCLLVLRLTCHAEWVGKEKRETRRWLY